MSANTLGDILQKIGDHAGRSLGITQEQAIALPEKPKELMVQGTVNQTFKIPIKSGKGSVEASKYTYGVKLTGYFVVESPNEGTWNIVATVAGKTVMNKSGVKKGEQIQFTAETNFWSDTEVKVVATWSVGGDTTATVLVHATY